MPVRLRQIETPEPLAIDYRPIASLIPHAWNARTHSEAEVALIAGSMREYGFRAAECSSFEANHRFAPRSKKLRESKG